MNTKKAIFSNPTRYERTEVGRATIPFKKGEWRGEPLELSSTGTVGDYWIYPFGKRYSDGSCRYGALYSTNTLQPYQELVVELDKPSRSTRLSEPSFVFPDGWMPNKSLDITIRYFKNNRPFIKKFSGWSIKEQKGMIQVVESIERIDNFVATLRVYLFSNQNHLRWELNFTASDPRITDLTYSLDELDLMISGCHFINIRNASRLGVTTITPYKHYKLVQQGNGTFGDGQGLAWTGEIIVPVNDPVSQASQAAAIELPCDGISMDWVECGEAYGALGAVPETARPLPDGGQAAATLKFNVLYSYLNSSGSTWDDLIFGLTRTPGQTGGQEDFGTIALWDVLHSARPELISLYKTLALEEFKRPGHYKEIDGSSVKSADHPLWIVWDSITHWHFGVSPDRLGKHDPSALMDSNGWRGKDWQHFSSHLLYTSALLTGSHLLIDELNHEAELYLAGHTLPSVLPGWSTNGRGEARGFGRPHLALLNHDTIIDRSDVRERMLDRFDEVIKNQWDGATRSPVKNWGKVNDPRVFPNAQDAWVPWNEHLGWLGMLALQREFPENNEIKELLVNWGSALIRWGWRLNESTNEVASGGGVKWYEDGSAIEPSQFYDPDFWRGGTLFNTWMAGITKFASESNLFDQDVKDKATRIYEILVAGRVSNFNPLAPYDDFGKWTALTGVEENKKQIFQD